MTRRSTTAFASLLRGIVAAAASIAASCLPIPENILRPLIKIIPSHCRPSVAGDVAENSDRTHRWAADLFAILRGPVNEGKTFLGRFSGKMPRCHWTAAISPQGRQRSSTHSPQPLQPQEPRGHTTSAPGTHNFGSGDTQCRACASFAFIRIQRDTGFVKHSLAFRDKALGRRMLPETGVSPPSLCPRSWRPALAGHPMFPPL